MFQLSLWQGIFGIALFKNKFLKPKEETSEQEPLTSAVEEAKEPDTLSQSDVAVRTFVNQNFA